MESEDRLKAKIASQHKTAAQEDLRRKAYGLRQKLARAKLVYHHQRAHWHALTGDEQMLWWEYSYGSLQKEVDEANEEYGHSLFTRYRGGGAHVSEIMREGLSLRQDPWQVLSSSPDV